ncbi:MAG: hypothetical protein S4CHLAM37_10970 [Chlamydiia bacterium]|nr:hypothetical protein [Chlamydiia bacterium]
MKFYKSLLGATVAFATLCSFADGQRDVDSVRSNPLLLKPAFELTGKDQVLLDILHHDSLRNSREDFSTLEETNGSYPEAYEKAYSLYLESLGDRPTRERYLSSITKAAKYLMSLLFPSDDVEEVAVVKEPVRDSDGHFVSLLIGIDYKNTKNELQNCIHDIEHVMDQLLRSTLGIKSNQMIVMSDYKYGTEFYPTKNNILKKFDEFASRANQTREAYFHYSGHGSYMWDKDGDEKDYKDEVLVPVDCDRSGYIRDDVIFERLIKGLNPSVKLTATTDCCHSGTIMDLPYKWLADGSFTEEQKLSYSELRDLPNVVMLSGCKDTQTSADGGKISGSHKGAGAMTAAYLETLREHNYVITYRQLLEGVHRKLIYGGFPQRPQLSSTHKLDLDDYYMRQQTALRP